MDLSAFLAVLREGEEGDRTLTIEASSIQPTELIDRLSRLDRLGLLSGDAILSLVAQAPIDPLNLMAVLLRERPTGWTFSAVDFSMVRVLVRDDRGGAAAAVRVDLMSDEVTALAVNAMNQLTVHSSWTPEGPDIMTEFQRRCDDAVAAAAREQRQQKRK